MPFPPVLMVFFFRVNGVFPRVNGDFFRVNGIFPRVNGVSPVLIAFFFHVLIAFSSM